MAEDRKISVRELLSRYDSRELSEWKAYYSIYPEPQERDDRRSGRIASILFNVNRKPDAEANDEWDYVWKAPERGQEEGAEEFDPLEERVARTHAAMSVLRRG